METDIYGTVGTEALSSELMSGLQISSNIVGNIEELPEALYKVNMDSSCSTEVAISSRMQYKTDEKSQCGLEAALPRCSQEEIDAEYASDCEILEDQFWEEFQPDMKLYNPRQKNQTPCVFEKEENSFTFRKIHSKEIREKKLPSSYYKFDKRTVLTLERLLDVRCFDQYQEVIGKGKNSVVIASGCTRLYGYLSFFNAVKIYKLSNDENFNNAIYKRTKREFEHLLNLGYSIENIPYVVKYEKNFIIMSKIGTDKVPAVPLDKLAPELYSEMYYKTVNDLRSLYSKQYVHGKLRAKNILIWKNRPYYIGWSHSIRTGESDALKKMIKDCHFITTYFKSKNVPVISTENLFKHATQVKDISPEVLDVIQNRVKVRRPGNPNLQSISPTNAPGRNCRFK